MYEISQGDGRMQSMKKNPTLATPTHLSMIVIEKHMSVAAERCCHRASKSLQDK